MLHKAESFQWINLMRGDTALMSLVNHRYLTTKPNEPGQASADGLAPAATVVRTQPCALRPSAP
jgi:hypothetical protein